MEDEELLAAVGLPATLSGGGEVGEREGRGWGAGAPGIPHLKCKKRDALGEVSHRLTY